MATYEYVILGSDCGQAATGDLVRSHYHSVSIATINNTVKSKINAGAVISKVELYLDANWDSSIGDPDMYFYFCPADNPGTGTELLKSTIGSSSTERTKDITSYVTKTYPFSINASYPNVSVYYKSTLGKGYHCDRFSVKYTYSIPTYTLTVTAGTGGTVSGGGTYNNQATATLKATPNTGYKFVKWSDGNTSATRTVTVTGNATYTATFEKLKYTVNFKNADGSAVSSKTLEHGATLGTLPTVSRSGYTFAGWMPCEPAKKTDGTVLDSYKYNGDKDSAQALHPDYKYSDKLSVHIEAYMSNWVGIGSGNSGSQIISCTESGGWGLGYMANSSGHGAELQAGGYKGIDFGFGTADKFLNWKWHTFDIVFSNGVFEAYVDGVKKGSQTMNNTTITYKHDNVIFVGAEAGEGTTPTGSYFKGYISNVFIANKGTRLVAATTSTVVEGDVDYYPVWRLNTPPPVYFSALDAFTQCEGVYIVEAGANSPFKQNVIYFRNKGYFDFDSAITYGAMWCDGWQFVVSSSQDVNNDSFKPVTSIYINGEKIWTK